MKTWRGKQIGNKTHRFKKVKIIDYDLVKLERDLKKIETHRFPERGVLVG